ncbi:septum site-determining protein MinC [Actimicrobium sp. CCI2.3]|uniref:septum site-determining protein MinC n=1 Tax=Actimicrobium sp. CCI2.3 TaxID=3048616 RepID=UPI002AB5A34F|nr:septum site-determining protein MinC [Actimicrobium sp. CCI2.3]MDY7572722.1 septum site-determining protein MinC [Actimicrobium sp. CCI2.3]MEB0022241.1 septum site-determining protein MinC [Actimicrobium sp. CCI2.3]
MQKNQTGKPIDIKISTVVAISAILHQTDPAKLDAAMRDMTGGEADFFDDELAVIDIGDLDLTGTRPDWSVLVGLLKSYRLHAVAVRNAPPGMEADILANGLTLDRSVKPRTAATPEPARPVVTAVVTPPIAAAAAMGTMIVDTPVRAGQRVYARGCDLIITAAVNNGAEVIADGSIHVYAPLRGRALAGASGNADARIFTSLMEAELVSIAGIYRTFENGYPQGLANHAVQIRLVGDRLDVLSVNS